MKFQEIKVGHPIYLLDKNKMEFRSGKVESVAPPYYANNGQIQRVIDLRVNFGEGSKTYVVPEENAVTYSGASVIATDKDTILLEVQAIRGTAEAVVKSYEENRQLVEKCDAVLEKIDDTIAEKRRNDQRLASLENKINELLQKLS